MKKIAVYIAIMEKQKKLQNIFLFFNIILFSVTLISFLLKVFHIVIIPFSVFLIFAVLFIALQNDFILQICRKCTERQFKKLYLKYLKAGNYYRTKRIVKILIAEKETY